MTGDLKMIQLEAAPTDIQSCVTVNFQTFRINCYHTVSIPEH